MYLLSVMHSLSSCLMPSPLLSNINPVVFNNVVDDFCRCFRFLLAAPCVQLRSWFLLYVVCSFALFCFVPLRRCSCFWPFSPYVSIACLCRFLLFVLLWLWPSVSSSCGCVLVPAFTFRAFYVQWSPFSVLIDGGAHFVQEWNTRSCQKSAGALPVHVPHCPW